MPPRKTTPATLETPPDLRTQGLGLAVSFLTSREPVSWSRVLASILLAVVGLAIGIAWTERGQVAPLLAYVLAASPGTIDEARADDVLDRLLATTGGKVGVVWSYNLERYTRTLVSARSADGRVVLSNVEEAPITRGGTGYTALVDALLTGEAPCFPIDNRAAHDTALLARTERVTAFCISGIPPAYGLGLRGTVVLFVDHLPVDEESGRYRVALRAAAQSLMRH